MDYQNPAHSPEGFRFCGCRQESCEGGCEEFTCGYRNVPVGGPFFFCSANATYRAEIPWEPVFAWCEEHVPEKVRIAAECDDIECKEHEGAIPHPVTKSQP